MTLSRPVSSLAPSAVGRKIFMTKMAWPREERAFILMLATVRLRLPRAMTAISSLAVFTVASATRTHTAYPHVTSRLDASLNEQARRPSYTGVTRRNNPVSAYLKGSLPAFEWDPTRCACISLQEQGDP